MARRHATLAAVVLEVGCPYCGEAQPSPCGSHLWEICDLDAVAGVPRQCAACAEQFVIGIVPNRVSVEHP